MIPTTIPPSGRLIKGAMIELSGEYSRMQETFRSLGFGLILATLLIYFLMAALFKSYLTPLVILFAVPLGLGRRDRRCSISRTRRSTSSRSWA